MNKGKKHIIGTIPIVLFLLFFVSFGYSNIEHSSQIYQNNNELKLESSGFWNLTGTTIYIDDTDPDYNWSKTASENGWCSGNGSIGNPYIIQDVVMDAQGSGTCIEIKNSNVYFSIENCSLSNAQYGIVLTDALNGLINDTIIFNMNGDAGANGVSGNPGTPGQDGTESIGIEISGCSELNITNSDVSDVNGGPGGTGGSGIAGVVGNVNGKNAGNGGDGAIA